MGIERDLIARAQVGDEDAVAALLEEHRPRLEALVRSRLGTALRASTTVEDVVQEVFLEACRSLPRFEWRGEDSFSRWLGGIAEHAILRASRRRERTLGAEAQALRLPPRSRAEVSPSKALRHEERFERLKGALENLSPEHREVILLSRIEGQVSLTASGDYVGTPLYMSPEQAQARKLPVDHRTDVYSLGATFYEVLTARPPFSGKDHRDTISQIVERDPVPPRKLNPRVPKDLETIVLVCLQKDPGDRYGTAEALAQDLRRFVRGDPIERRPPGRWEILSRRARRHRWKSSPRRRPRSFSSPSARSPSGGEGRGASRSGSPTKRR